MARCLITGHRGYIGSRLYKRLKELGHEVQGIDIQPDEHGNPGHSMLRFLQEGTDGRFHPHYWNFKPEYVFHLACIPRVAYSVEEPVKTMKNNVLCTSNVLNFARKVGAKRVIYSGSSSVNGNGNGPTSPYGLQKLISELECKLYSELYGLDTVSLRYFNVYSEDQKATGPYATAISNFMQHIRDNKNPFISGDGEQRRDMLYVQDAVAANIFAMQYEDSFNGQNFDVGTGTNISLNEVKSIVNEHFPNVVFDHVEDRKGDVRVTCANTTPLAELGWRTEVSVQKGINSCYKKLKEKLNG